MKRKKNIGYYVDYIKKFSKLLDDINLKKVENLSNKIISAKKNKILIFGNGAGASIASHFSNDLSNTTKIKTLSFDNSAHLTCYANDYGFENWVKKTIEIYAEKRDLIILISASGNSKNMINASKFCKKKKLNFFSLTGFKKNNLLNKNSKNHIWINSNSYNEVELAQLFILLSIVDNLNSKK